MPPGRMVTEVLAGHRPRRITSCDSERGFAPTPSETDRTVSPTSMSGLRPGAILENLQTPRAQLFPRTEGSVFRFSNPKISCTKEAQENLARQDNKGQRPQVHPPHGQVDVHGKPNPHTTQDRDDQLRFHLSLSRK